MTWGGAGRLEDSARRNEDHGVGERSGVHTRASAAPQEHVRCGSEGQSSLSHGSRCPGEQLKVYRCPEMVVHSGLRPELGQL